MGIKSGFLQTISNTIFNSSNKVRLISSTGANPSLLPASFFEQTIQDLGGTPTRDNENLKITWSNTNTQYSGEAENSCIVAGIAITQTVNNVDQIIFVAPLGSSINVSSGEMVKIAPYNAANQRGMKIEIQISDS